VGPGLSIGSPQRTAHAIKLLRRLTPHVEIDAGESERHVCANTPAGSVERKQRLAS
jgi:hypothetical protein